MTFSELLDYCESEALLAKLETTELSVWRYICRQYSQKYHTPLDRVLHDLDPKEVILAHYESQMDSIDLEEDLEKLLESVYSLKDPAYAKAKKDSFEEDIKKYEKQEEDRVKANKPIPKGSKKTLLEKETDPSKDQSTGGSVSFSDFDEEGNK